MSTQSTRWTEIDLPNNTTVPALPQDKQFDKL